MRQRKVEAGSLPRVNRGVRVASLGPPMELHSLYGSYLFAFWYEYSNPTRAAARARAPSWYVEVYVQCITPHITLCQVSTTFIVLSDVAYIR